MEPGTIKKLPGSVKLETKQCVDIFIAPGLALRHQEKANSQKPGEFPGLLLNYDYYLVLRYIVSLMVVIFLIDLLLTVSTYRSKRLKGRYLGFFEIPAAQREREVKKKLFFLGLILLILALISLNYFILFWILSFFASIFLFRREISERGKNHKSLSRSLLFVILTQIFSSICGEILFILFLPLYQRSNGYSWPIYLLSDIILGWTIILGSSVTVLIGIITQVIWSGQRLTEQLKD